MKSDKLEILSSSGYHDKYYWDMEFVCKYNGKKYLYREAGSFSGYIPYAMLCKEITEEETEGIPKGCDWKLFEFDKVEVEQDIIEAIKNVEKSGLGFICIEGDEE